MMAWQWNQGDHWQLTAAPLIALDNVSRIFDDGSVVALAGIDIAIARGEFVSIVGPSGSGKSSLVHIMAGFDRPTGGRVLWQGREVRDRQAVDDAQAQQDRHRLPGIPAAADADGDRECRDRDERHRACRGRSAGSARPMLLDQVGLGGRFGHLPFALSGGERQRVAIARSLANRPELLLSDEPTGNLDSANAAAVVELLLALRAEAGMTLVLVTHDEALAARADRLIHVRDGRVADDTRVAGEAAP